MWYVNWRICEGYETKEEGFILTMWYVNHILFPLLLFFTPGFILTMWYVNNIKRINNNS